MLVVVSGRPPRRFRRGYNDYRVVITVVMDAVVVLVVVVLDVSPGAPPILF